MRSSCPPWAYALGNLGQHTPGNPAHVLLHSSRQPRHGTKRWADKENVEGYVWTEKSHSAGKNDSMPPKGKNEWNQTQLFHFLLEEESITYECLCVHMTRRRKDSRGRSRTKKRWAGGRWGGCEQSAMPHVCENVIKALTTCVYF